MSTDRDFTPGGRDSNPGWPRVSVPYINGWINETKKALALEGGMDKIKDLLAGLKKMACGELSEAAAGTAPVPEVAQVMDVTLAKAAEQNYAYKGRKQYQPPGKPTKDSKTVEGPGAFEEIEAPDPDKVSDRKGDIEEIRGSIAKFSKLLEHWGKPDSAVAEQEEPAAEEPPAGAEPEHAPTDPPAEEEPKVSLDVAIKDRLAHGVAEGVINSLSAVYGDMIDFGSPEVLKALDEIERQYTQKGRQFFTELRAEVGGLGSIERDRAIRSAVRVFRELA